MPTDGLCMLLECATLLDHNDALFHAIQLRLPPAELFRAMRTTVRAFVNNYNQMLAAVYEPNLKRPLPTRMDLIVATDAFEQWRKMPHFAEMTDGVRMNYIERFHMGAPGTSCEFSRL